MSFLQAIVLSIVEGLSEFLPISSTGHLVLASHILNLEQTEFLKSFQIFIQLGAIFAVPFLYWKKLLNNFYLWKLIVVGFLPAGVLGFLFFDYIKGTLVGNEWVTVLALFGGGIFLIYYERMFYDRSASANLDHSPSGVDSHLSIKRAFLIGLAQSVSMIPGVSRAAATIVGGLLVGLNKKTVVEFSFLLAIPTVLGATTLDLVKSDFSFTQQEWMVLSVGFIGSFITAIAAIKFLISWVQTHNFSAFGVYRIAVAVLYGLVFL
ncbi:MAG: undecaprenyl-diphosphate phosphatase [Patescibacteria group bacterium]